MFQSTISNEDIQKLELLKFTGKIHLIKTNSHIKQAVEILSRETKLGFDTETKPAFKKNQHHKVALLQLSTPTDAFLFQLKYLSEFEDIFSLLANPDITKIGVAIKRDIEELQELHHFESQSFIDLQNYVSQFGIENKGLRKLAAITLNGRISKQQQRSNWENKQLSPAQTDYAATDAWVSLMIYDKLKSKS